MAIVLVIDDEESICWGIDKLCHSMGHSTIICSSAEDGFLAAKTSAPDLIVLDVRLPGVDGLNAMRQFQTINSTIPIVIMTAYGELDSAVAAVKNGAFEYLPKPFDLNRVQHVIERALSQKHQAGHQSNETTDSSKNLGDLIGSCPKMQEVFRRIAFAATSDASVLINGESGTGKELAARAIHRYSSRSDQPFVAVNIAALPPTLAESELFGHVKASFTGADRDREGLLVQAHGGTLFLDELADIPLALQVKLLRCLDQGEVVPVGSNQPVQTDFRIISATHQDLSTLVANGKFRHDLFFRICAFQIDLPPLRERGDDLIQLAKFFIQNLHGHNTETPVPRLSKGAIQAIVSRQWDGNVRELQNAVEHSLILARGVEILEEHLPEPIQTSQHLQVSVESSDLKISLDQLIRTWTENQIKLIKNGKIKTDNLYEEFLACVEPEFLSTVRQHFDNQYLAASKVLGIHRTTLKKKLTDHGIDKE